MDLIFIISFQLIFFAVGVLMCATEDDCPKGYTCIDNTCRKCVTCSLLFRKGSSCIVDFKDCEGCLPGYEEISVTDFSAAIKPCKPIKKKVKIKECTNDSSCPPNNYCSEESCVKCFNCSVVNRLPPVDKCAKGLNECGSCIFSEVPLTTDTDHRLCEVVVPWDMPLATYTSLFGLLFAIIFLAVMFLIRKTKSRKSDSTVFHSETRPSAPPLYVLDPPQEAEKYDSFVTQYKRGESCVALFENEQMQQAKVFKQPDAPYYTMGEEGDEAYDVPPTGDNSCTCSTSCAVADSAQEHPSYFSVSAFTRRLDEHDSTDSSSIGANAVNVDNNNPASVDAVALNMENPGQVAETPVQEPTDPVMPRLERGEA